MQDWPTFSVNWGMYLAPKLSIATHSKPHKTRMGDGCGITALSMLTGIHPDEFSKHRPKVDEKGMTDRAMKRALRKLGHTVIPVTKTSVRKVWLSKALKPDHCLLINGMVDPMENSWLILHKNKLWHNFGVEEGFNAMYFLNNPTETVYLVWHPSWAEVNQVSKNYRPTKREQHRIDLAKRVCRRFGYDISNVLAEVLQVPLQR